MIPRRNSSKEAFQAPRPALRAAQPLAPASIGAGLRPSVRPSWRLASAQAAPALLSWAPPLLTAFFAFAATFFFAFTGPCFSFFAALFLGGMRVFRPNCAWPWPSDASDLRFFSNLLFFCHDHSSPEHLSKLTAKSSPEKSLLSSVSEHWRSLLTDCVGCFGVDHRIPFARFKRCLAETKGALFREIGDTPRSAPPTMCWPRPRASRPGSWSIEPNWRGSQRRVPRRFSAAPLFSAR